MQEQHRYFPNSLRDHRSETPLDLERMSPSLKYAGIRSLEQIPSFFTFNLEDFLYFNLEDFLKSMIFWPIIQFSSSGAWGVSWSGWVGAKLIGWLRWSRQSWAGKVRSFLIKSSAVFRSLGRRKYRSNSPDHQGSTNTKIILFDFQCAGFTSPIWSSEIIGCDTELSSFSFTWLLSHYLPASSPEPVHRLWILGHR